MNRSRAKSPALFGFIGWPSPKPRQRFIEQKQYDALVANCSDLFMRAMLCLAYCFGFRKSELLILKVSDVNLLAGTVQLRDRKKGEARKVSLTPDAKNLLAACITGKNAEDYVFTGKGKHVRDLRGAWEKITLAALACSFTICAGAPSATWYALEYRKWFA